MKNSITLVFLMLSSIVFAQNTGDTLVVPTFNYTQTHGAPWDGTIRDTMIDFPDNPDLTYHKILMAYNMRCKDGLVSVPGATNMGCGEWDYSCNTYITDSSKVDSVLSFTNSHYISAFSGTTFDYVEDPLYNYYQYLQKEVQIDNTNSETLSTVGAGSLALSHVLATDNYSGKSQYLYTQAELSAAGVTSGNIDAILVNVSSGNADANYLKIRMKQTDKTALSSSDPDLDGFTEVYFHGDALVPGTYRAQFHTPFTWDGTSNIIVEFSFTKHTPDDALEIEGEPTTNVSGIYTTNGYSLDAVNGEIDITTDDFSSISDEITVSFWSYGNEEIQPINNSIISGKDANNRRQLNLHLPWGDSNIYFDCGNDGSGYDRINKSATPDEYKGSWCQWAVTKNTTTGDMKIYRNGELWHTGTGKTRLIDIQKLILGSIGTKTRYYFGKMDEFRFWDKELDQQTIQNWMYKPVDATHPDYAHLVAYYKMDEGTGTLISDASGNNGTGTITDFLYWIHERGDQLNRGFVEAEERPNITFAQGDYDLTITDQTITDSVMLTPNIVREYEIVPRYGTMLNDSIAEASVNEYWEARYEYIFDPEGNVIDSIENVATGSITIAELTYYKRYPSKFELMSFVTPYGIYLNLGDNGKTWLFDVTDYAPVLKGRKRMTIERGGQWQEDMDIKFLYIVGTPARDVIDVQQIWKVSSSSYTSIQNERAYETRDVLMPAEGEAFKIRSVITGHGQQGEFSPRHHTLNLNEGDIEFDWVVWNECSTIPIYPQGGTWIYDRAGWCPGNPSNIHDFDITAYVTPGQTTSIDYNVTYANGTSNYVVNNQLMAYGLPNFNLDAAVVRILKPNTDDASEIRFNPACTFPEVVIQNTGATTLTSLDIEYSVEGGDPENYTWVGSLAFMKSDTVTLPVDELSFWIGTADRFTVTISNPNGQDDEYSFNNSYTTSFGDIHVYADGQILTVQLKTNNYGHQSSYILYKDDGTVYYERDNCDNNTLYNDPFYLNPGCYKLQIFDSGNDGLEFWANPGQGEGYFRILNADSDILYSFEPDFGGYAIHEFGIGNITKIDEIAHPFILSVYPNPVSDHLQINIRGTGNTKVTARLSNSVMKQVMEKEWTANEKEFSTVLDMKDLPSGVYFLQITYGNHSKTEKIIKF